MAHLITQERFIQIISGKNQTEALGRALVHLLNRQTASERQTAETKEHNGVGFTEADAYSGTLSAKYFIAHQTLEPWQVEKWMKPNVRGVPRIAKYWKQIDEEAQRKAETNRNNV